MNYGYFLTFVVIAISGNPAATSLGKEGTYIVVFLMLALYWLFRGRQPIERTAFLVPIVIGILAFFHLLNFGSIVLMASLGLIVKIMIGLLAATVIKDFFYKYIQWMAVLACVSLVFYLPQAMGVDLISALSFLNVPIENSHVRHIGIHNFHHMLETRNSGMFWEPGAFAGYLVLALLLVVGQRKTRPVAKWVLIALVLGLLSTQSTMGYIAGAVIGFYYLVDQFMRERIVIMLPYIPYILFSAAVSVYIAATELDFLGEKINEQIVNTVDARGVHQINRFGNFLYDLDHIKQRPLMGWSANPETRFYLDPMLQEFISGQGNALTGYWVRFGGIGFFVLMWGLYSAGARRAGTRISGFFTVLIYSILFVGEQYINYPLLYAFLVSKSLKKDSMDALSQGVSCFENRGRAV